MPPENNAQELRSHCSVAELRAEKSLAYFAVNMELHPTIPYATTNTAIYPETPNPKLLRDAAKALRRLAEQLELQATDDERACDPA